MSDREDDLVDSFGHLYNRNSVGDEGIKKKDINKLPSGPYKKQVQNQRQKSRESGKKYHDRQKVPHTRKQRNAAIQKKEDLV